MSRIWLPVLLTLFTVGLVSAQPSPTPESQSDAPKPPELPESSATLNPRTEAEDDQLASLSHYAQAMLLKPKGKTALALRHLQRAWRYGDESDKLLTDIVPLAFEARQPDMATRYAVLAAERAPKDPLLVRRLAIYLTDKRDYARALRMYEQSLAKDDQLKKGVPEDLSAATLYAEMGRLYFLNDQPQKAARAFGLVQKALHDEASTLDAEAKKTLVSEGATTYALWGEAFLEAGQPAKAAEAFRHAHEEKKDAALLAYRLARVAAAEKNADEALKQLDEYFAAKTDDSGDGPYALLAKLTIERAETPSAGQESLINKLQALHQDQPNNVPLAFALSDALWTAGKVAEAAPLLKKTLSKQPESAHYAKLIEHYRQAKEYRELLAAAGQLAETSGSLDSLDDLLTKLKGDAGLIRGCVAIARESAAQTDPKPEAAPIFAAALLAREAGKITAAQELFAKVVELKPDQANELKTQWALGLFLRDRHEEAVEIFRQLLSQDPLPKGSSGLRYYYAGALEMAGQTDEALKEIRQAAAANANNPRFESRVGWILYHAKRYPEAAEAYERLIEKHNSKQLPEIREALRSARLALSNIALEMGDFPQAVEWLEQVLDEYPEDPGALNDLGYLWADRGVHLERALRMTQQAVAAEPENKSYRDSLGWAYYRLGRYAEAVKELTAATEGDGESNSDGVLLDHLGDALDKVGRREEARAAWQKAADAFKQEGDAKKAGAVQAKLTRNE